MTEFSKTAQYAGLTDLQGRLLQVLARGRAGGLIGETGTGCGAGRAWMASAVGLDTRLMLDDFHPPIECWPENVTTPDEHGRSVTAARKHWLEHPALFAAEVRVHPQVSSILGTLKVVRR